MSAVLLAVVALPLLVALVIPALGSRPRGPALTVGAAPTALALATILAVLAAGAGATVRFPFLLDSELLLTTAGPRAVLLPTVLAIATLVLLAATAAEETREPRFSALMLLFTAAAAVTVLAGTLPTLLLGWEVMGAASYALIGYRHADARRVRSGAAAFLTTRAADLGLYLAVAAAFAGSGPEGSLTLESLPNLDGAWRDVAAAGILIAALGKAAQLPFSFWLSRAMDGPSPVSALLHSAAMVALGGYLLVVNAPLLAATGWADHVAAWVGVITAVVMGAVAVTQTDLKQLLAASTSAQLGFVVLGAGVGATGAATAHLIAHAAVKASLFLAAGAWLEAVGSKQLDALSGAARRWPALGALAVVALLSLAGLPPLSLWATKDAVLAGALEESAALYVAGLVAAALSAAYAFTALLVIARKSRSHEETQATGTVPLVVPLALAPMTLGAVGLGVLALPAVLGTLGSVPASPHAWELLLSAAVVLAAAVFVAAARRSSSSASQSAVVAWLRGWLFVEPLVHRLVVSPTLRAADLARRFDDQVVAGAVDRAGGAAVRLAGASILVDATLARGVQGSGSGTLATADASVKGDEAIAAGVSGFATGARRAGSAVRRPSGSGQLHHYYLQLVVGVLLVLVVTSTVLIITSSR